MHKQNNKVNQYFTISICGNLVKLDAFAIELCRLHVFISTNNRNITEYRRMK